MQKNLWRPLSTGIIVLLLASMSQAQFRQKRGEVKHAAVDTSALRAGHSGVAAVVVEIHDGFHAQSHTPLDPSFIKFEVKPAENPAIIFGEPQYPPGQIEEYPALGKLSVYTGRVVIYIPFQVKADVKPGPTEIAGKVVFQACDDKACYPPESPGFSIQTQIVPADAQVKPNEPELFKGYQAPDRSGPATRSAAIPAGGPSGPSGSEPIKLEGAQVTPGAIALEFLTAFLVGIIFNVMPCVLPVLPLKAMGFYQASDHSRLRSLAFGTAFSLGLIATFAALGILIFGYQFDWGQFFTRWWFTLGIVIILLAMAAHTFGAFNVGMPRGLYSISPRHDTYWGNFLLGILTALLSTPCTFGMFVGLLAWAISLNWPLIGILILMTVGVGMAFPYLILSALPEVARRFVRTGPWAELVKQMMGFLLLLAAVYFARPFIGRVVHGEAFWWLPFGVIVLAAIYLAVRTLQVSRTIVGRLVGTSIALLLVLGSLGAVQRLTARPYAWQPYSDAALETARRSGRIALVEFTADWCGNCQYVEASVLHSKPIVNAVRTHDIVMLKADVTHDDAPARPLLEKLNPAGSIPLTVIYSPNRNQPIELTGIYSTKDLKHAIDLAAESRATALAQR